MMSSQPELERRASHRALNNDKDTCYTPLGAILNTEKTRIMTTTTGKSLIPRLKQGAPMKQLMAAIALEEAIVTYSTTKNESGTCVPCEVTDGLLILGAPVGSTTFCNNFIDKAISCAQTDAAKLVTDLEDLQTTLRLFSVCTAHKVTHLSSHAVYNTPLGELPNNYWLWDNAMTTQFSAITSNLIAHITKATALPPCLTSRSTEAATQSPPT
ncbi:hypothetical protein ACHAXN_002743 [Cyclotella atomus]